MEKSPNIDSCDKGSGPRTPLIDKGCTSLFPSLLAIPDTLRRSRSARCRARGRGHREAWEWVKVLWALFTFFEGGSPFKAADQKELVARARNTTWTSTHSEYAGCLHKQINRYLRMRDEDQSLSRGILKLSELVKIVKSSAYQGHKVDGTMQQVAKNVKPDRMSLPSKAGIIEPQDFLKGSQLEQFRTMPEHIPVENTNEPPVKGCFKVLGEDLPGVYRKLLESGVAVLLPEELAVRGEDGKILTGGLFAVNQVERRLVWAKLPHGCLLTQLILPKGHSIRGSGDDLSNYFYLLKHNPNWLPRNAIGSVFDGEGFEAFGGVKGRKYLLSFCVVAMGDLNAVDIAQQVHVEILRDCHCMQPSEVLSYKHVVPASHCYEGLYIDDHVTVQILPKKKNRKKGEKFRDETIIANSRAQYAKHGIPTSASQAFKKSENFVAWGTEVNSASGRVGAPLKKLCQLGRVILEVLKLPRVSKKMLQQVAGLLIHPFMHRRSLMCLLQETFTWVETLDDKISKPLPPAVREELIWCTLVLPVAEANIRWEISNRIGCSDASLSGGGRAAAWTTTPLAQTLYRFAEHKGEHVRLDWTHGGLIPESSMSRAPSELEAILGDHPWVSTESCTFAHKQHINILETRMIYRELVDIVHSCHRPQRCVLVVDSRAAAGAWAKGRSSSRQLNRLLRRSLGWTIAGRKSIHVIWVRSEANPADHPSRGREIPKPVDPPSTYTQEVLGPDLKHVRQHRSVKDIWKKIHSEHDCAVEGDSHALRRLNGQSDVRSETSRNHPAAKVWSFREIFADTAHLSKAVRSQGTIRVQEPFELMHQGRPLKDHDILDDNAFDRLCKDATEPNQIWHFGFPCGSFSQLQHLNQGTRTHDNPAGDGTVQREVVGNEIMRRTLWLCKLLHQNGSFFTLENPGSSYAWKMPEYIKLRNDTGSQEVRLDQCCFNLLIPNGAGKLELAKKPTVFAGTLPYLDRLHRKCARNHQHVAVMGGVKHEGKWTRRSTLAGAYPQALCNAYAKIISRMFDERNRTITDHHQALHE